MAGSLSWNTYQDDTGTDWAIFCDKSNFAAANSNTGVGAPPNQLLKPPANMRPRYAVYGDAAGDRRIKVIITNQTIYNALDAGDTIPDPIAGGTATLAFIRKRPEVISPTPTSFDTGLTNP